jgi:dipicolinate synthase subunit A
MIQSILIVGGDKRQLALADMLKERGHNVSLQGFTKLGIQYEPIESPGTIFLPVPYRNPDGSLKAPYTEEKLELANVVRQYPRSVYFLGGYDTAAREAFDGQVHYIDLMADEAYQVENALLTTQAAVCAFQQTSEVALCDLHCVVVGYGRIAKFLCRLLIAHGAQVTATARKESDLVLIRSERMNAIHTKRLARILPEADVIFNTVPHHVFGKEELKSIRSGVMLMELASPPYGLDLKLAEELGVRVRIESGLPGRYFPVSAAQAMLRAFESEDI